MNRPTILVSAACAGLIMLVAATSAQEADNSLRDLLRGFLGQSQETHSPETQTGNTAVDEVVRRVPLGQSEVQLSFAPLVERTAPAVVNIYTARRVQRRSPFAGDPFFEQFFGNQFSGPPRVQSSLGSGVIVDPDGLVVTNNHVIAGADEIRVVLADGREFESNVILRDERADLAVIRIASAEPLTALVFANSDDLMTGDLVLAIGNPFGIGQTITSGIVSALARSRIGVSDFGFFVQTDAAINPGNSGGALIDMQGRLIGINTAIFSRSGGSNGIGFAIPANMVAAVVAQARGGADAFERPYLGAQFQIVTPQIAESLGLVRPSGALVADVTPGGPADASGLRAGDVVLAIEGASIEHPDALGYRLATIGPGRTVQLRILSRGSQRDVAVALTLAPETRPAQMTIIEGRSPFAGATIANLSPRLRQRLNMPGQGDGVVITDIARGAPAMRAGLRPGDVIVAIGGEQIVSVDDVLRATARDGRAWRFTVDRQGRILNQFLRF